MLLTCILGSRNALCKLLQINWCFSFQSAKQFVDINWCTAWNADEILLQGFSNSFVPLIICCLSKTHNEIFMRMKTWFYTQLAHLPFGYCTHRNAYERNKIRKRGWKQAVITKLGTKHIHTVCIKYNKWGFL